MSNTFGRGQNYGVSRRVGYSTGDSTSSCTIRDITAENYPVAGSADYVKGEVRRRHICQILHDHGIENARDDLVSALARCLGMILIMVSISMAATGTSSTLAAPPTATDTAKPASKADGIDDGWSEWREPDRPASPAPAVDTAGSRAPADAGYDESWGGGYDYSWDGPPEDRR
jgi:hypothetical protein